ncbi:MAG: hypothetical protein ACKVUT_17040 [Gaiella sp.]
MLDAVGSVEIEFGASRGRLVADGQQLFLDVDEPSVLFGVLGLGQLRVLGTELARAGFTLHVQSGDRRLLLAGRQAKPGILSRLLRLPRVQLGPRFAVRSALGRGRPRP